MKRLLFYALAFAFGLGCSDQKPHSHKKPSPQNQSGGGDTIVAKPNPPLPPNPPGPDLIKRYCPPTKFQWWSNGGCFFDLPKADTSLADDYFQWFEALYENWDTSLEGHSPKLYLKRFPLAPDGIEYVDQTKGAVKGIEKLKTVVPVMLQRCPSMAEDRFKAPLEVRWNDRTAPGTSGAYVAINTQLNDTEDGGFLPAAPLLWKPWIEIKGDYVKPANNEQGWQGYQYPNQLFTEQTGGKTYADGSTALFSLDQTFAHEYAHHLAQAWALNVGKSPIHSFMFTEFLAELVRSVCWGSLFDNPARVLSEIDYDRLASQMAGKPFGSLEADYKTINRRRSGINYDLKSLEKLIIWEHYKGRYDSDKFFRAIWDTMYDMTGVIITDYPAYSSYDGSLLHQLLPWSRAINNQGIIQRAPKMFTRQEFLQKFCDHYPCGELEYLIKADAEGNKKTEW